MPVTEQTYQAIALEDPEGNWELHRGRLREKPSMSFGHNDSMMELGRQLLFQLDRNVYKVRIYMGRVRRQDETYYIPDVFVIPMAYTTHLREHPNSLEVYDRPLPLVAEVWSPSTGEYDIDAKLPEYQRRGDREIWFLHPHERSLRAWRRNPDGTYAEAEHRGGTVRPAWLPNVEIDLDALFAD